jgi:hypothetical protein
MPAGLLAFARDGGQAHGARAQRLAPGAAEGEQRGVGRHVELQVAADAHVRRAERAQALRIGRALRQHARHAARRRRHQRGQPLAAPLAAL